MRIIHVVSLITPDGSYGGPLRVALNQVRALREAGHEAIIAAGARGYTSTYPSTFDGVPVRLFPAMQALPGTGFAGLCSPGLIRWLRHVIPTADAVHIHMARDLVSLPAAILARSLAKDYHLQTHGMIDESRKLLAAPLDLLATRPALRAASTIFSLTEKETNDLRQVAPGLDTVVRLHNGVPLSHLRAKPQSMAPDVLFLARLHSRKRPMVFVRAAQALAKNFPFATFTLVGPDEGEGSAVNTLLSMNDASGRIQWVGSLAPEQTLARMAESSIYVLPSVDEPYGMTVLEAMSVGLPVVVPSSCGLAPVVSRSRSGIVTGETEKELIQALTRLLSDPTERLAMGQNGLQTVVNIGSMNAVAQKLASIYSHTNSFGSRTPEA